MRTWLSRLRSQAAETELRIGSRKPRPPGRPVRIRTVFDTGTAAHVEMREKAGVAILPFTDLAPWADFPYVADGFARDLAQLISLNPSFFAEVLDVPHAESSVEGAAVAVEQDLLLEGALARVDRRMNVETRVIECSSGDILWSDRFWAPLERVALLQDDIAEAVTGAVASTPYFLRAVSRPAGTSCAAAWALRQAARTLLHQGPDAAGLDGAVRLFSHSSRLDPLYADAKIGLAEALSLRPLLMMAPDGDADRARRDAVLDAAEILSPSHVELPFIRGLKELDSGRPANAALALARSVRVAAITIPARIFLSIAEARSGQARAARNDAVLAIRRAGRPGWTALADYARAEAALARGAVQEAEAAVEAAIKAVGGPAQAPPLVLLMRSLLLAQQGHLDSARLLLVEHWPCGLAMPVAATVRPWLDALPGGVSRTADWLEQVIGRVSREN